MKKLIVGLLCAFISISVAEDSVFVVSTDKEKGKAAAEKLGGKWCKSLSKAVSRAEGEIGEGKNVVIKMTAGEYKGDLGSGAYEFPAFKNEKASLTIEGGYNADFSARSPFKTPTKIVTVADRSAPMIKFGRNSKLKSFKVDGLLFDSQASNKYDAKSNSLKIGSSCTHVYFQFSYLETNELAFVNSVFLNSANRVMEPLIRAATDKAVIRYENCIFLNNRIPLKLDSARFRQSPAKIIVNHCSFLLNWAYNPDPGTGNPAALEIGPYQAAKEVILTNNLFYSNFGGAILALNKKMPALTVNNNNFVGNGLLHGKTEADAVCMIVSAGGKKQDLPMDSIEDVNAVDEAEDNVSISPGINLTLGSPLVVDSSKVKAKDNWQNEVRRILNMNLDGGTVAIKDYCPRKDYSTEAPPFPANPDAVKYGAQADKVLK